MRLLTRSSACGSPGRQSRRSFEQVDRLFNLAAAQVGPGPLNEDDRRISGEFGADLPGLELVLFARGFLETGRRRLIIAPAKSQHPSHYERQRIGFVRGGGFEQTVGQVQLSLFDRLDGLA